MKNSSQEPLITHPKEAITDLSNPLDKSTDTDGFYLPVSNKPEKKYQKLSPIIICCLLSIASTSLAICATLGLFN